MSCAVEAAGLSFRYPDGRAALSGVDLRARHGERIAVLGPNGAGKTTLMMHLNGLMLGSGRLAVAVLTVVPRTVHELRRRVGLVFQDPDDQLFMPTVEEDMAFGPLNPGLDRGEVRRRVAEGAGGGFLRRPGFGVLYDPRAGRCPPGGPCRYSAGGRRDWPREAG